MADRDFIVTMDVRTGTNADGHSVTRQVIERVSADDGLKAAREAVKLYGAEVLEVKPAWEEATLFDGGTGEVTEPSDPHDPGGPDGPPAE